MQRVYTPNNQRKKGPGRIPWWIVIATVVVILLALIIAVPLLLIPVSRTTELEPTRAVVAVMPTQETVLPVTMSPTETATATAVGSPGAVPSETGTAVPAATATLPLPTVTPLPPQAAPTQAPVILPTATTLPATAAPTAVPTSWRAEYFNNRDLVGTPALVRDDANLAFDWGGAAPGAGIASDNFSVRWQQTRYFNDGSYRFHVRSDDGVRVWLNNQLIIDQWHDAANTTYSADRSLAAGFHTLQVAYYENSGDARIQFWWEKLTATHYPEWKGEYWSNRQLSGTAALVRNDASLDFNWGRSAPAAGLPADDFSARWTRTLHFEDGRYRFHTLVDDGVRLYVDNTLLIDQWRDGSLREVTADVNLSRGNHTVRVDYYEHGGDARIRTGWERTGGIGYPEWKGEYWSNREFKGNPALVRNDARIDFNWDTGAPAAGVPADDFAVRWSRNLNLEAGVYRFYANADDGIRIYVDGSRVLDQWHDSGADRTYQTDLALAAGTHQVIVEYYEHQFGARVKVWWERISALPPTPTTSPTPTQPATVVPTATASPTQTRPATTIPTATTAPTTVPTATPTATASPPPTATPSPTPSPTSLPTSSPTPVPDARITLAPNTGSANMRVTVTGQGFPAETAVHLYLGRRGQAPYQAAQATGLSNSNGKINIDFIMPANWPDGTAIVENVVVVYAATADSTTDSQVAAAASFTFVPAAEPRLRLNPEQGNLGTRVRVTGSGFPAGARVNLYLRTPDTEVDSVTYGEATANAKGNFVIDFTVPSTWSDGTPITGATLRVIAATDDDSVRVRSEFTLVTAVWEQAGYFLQ